jgi:hypothetical protein
VHQGDVGTHALGACDLADEASPPDVGVKESLVKRGDRLASSEVRPIEPDEVTVLGEGSSVASQQPMFPASISC